MMTTDKLISLCIPLCFIFQTSVEHNYGQCSFKVNTISGNFYGKYSVLLDTIPKVIESWVQTILK